MQYNKVMLAGNLTRDVEARVSKSDSAISNFGLAINRKFKDKETVTFVDLTAFGKTAEFVQKYFKKGSNIFIEGRLDFQTWEEDSGQKRSKLSVIAENVSFTGPATTGATATDEEEPKY